MSEPPGRVYSVFYRKIRRYYEKFNNIFKMYKQINYGKGFFPSSNRRPSQTDSVSTQLCARAALSVRVVSLLFPFFFSRTYINLKSRLMNCFRPGAHEDGFNTSRVRRKSRRGT